MTELIETAGRILADHDLEEVRTKLTEVVMETFRLRPMPSGHITEGELQRRLDVTVKIWNHLFGEYRWSKDRALDHILKVMVAVIDGARLTDNLPEPEVGEAARDGSTMWAPGQLQEIEAERRLSALAVNEGHVIQLGVSQCGDDDHSGGER
jgi:hypothetical protein